jgi:hypothetical protein
MKKIIIMVCIIMSVIGLCGCHAEVTTVETKSFAELFEDYVTAPKDFLGEDHEIISIKKFGKEIGFCYVIRTDDGHCDLYLGEHVSDGTMSKRNIDKLYDNIHEYCLSNGLVIDNIIFVEEFN